MQYGIVPQFGNTQLGYQGQLGSMMDTVKSYWTNYKWYMVALAGTGLLFFTAYGKKLLKRKNPYYKIRISKRRGDFKLVPKKTGLTARELKNRAARQKAFRTRSHHYYVTDRSGKKRLVRIGRHKGRRITKYKYRA